MGSVSKLIPDILAYINESPTPVTSAMVAKAFDNPDTDLFARTLASMNQRKTPLIARQPVAPERKANTSMRFEYFKVAGAPPVSRPPREGTLAQRIMGYVEQHPDEWVISTQFSAGSNMDAVSHAFGRLVKRGELKVRTCTGRGRSVTHEYQLARRPEPLPLPPIIELTKATELPVIEDLPPPMSGVEALARLIGRRIARTMMQALQDEIEEQLEKMSNNLIEKWVDEKARPMIHRAEAQPEKERLPRVLIAGLLPSQAGIIKAEFGEVFDLDFYTTDSNLKHLHEKLRGKVDHFFTFTSKIEHAAEEFAKLHGIKINRCSGGMTMLRQKLEQLYVEGAVA